jgi:hypothetical protein
MLFIRLTRIAILVLALVIPATRAYAESADRSAAKSNIVFILSDDQAWMDYGLMGHPDIRTPHLDKSDFPQHDGDYAALLHLGRRACESLKPRDRHTIFNTEFFD